MSYKPAKQLVGRNVFVFYIKYITTFFWYWYCFYSLYLIFLYEFVCVYICVYCHISVIYSYKKNPQYNEVDLPGTGSGLHNDWQTR